MNLINVKWYFYGSPGPSSNYKSWINTGGTIDEFYFYYDKPVYFTGQFRLTDTAFGAPRWKTFSTLNYWKKYFCAMCLSLKRIYIETIIILYVSNQKNI